MKLLSTHPPHRIPDRCSGGDGPSVLLRYRLGLFRDTGDRGGGIRNTNPEADALRYPIRESPEQAGIPKRPKGADCKSAGDAFGGSNPSPGTGFPARRKMPP